MPKTSDAVKILHKRYGKPKVRKPRELDLGDSFIQYGEHTITGRTLIQAKIETGGPKTLRKLAYKLFDMADWLSSKDSRETK